MNHPRKVMMAAFALGWAASAMLTGCSKNEVTKPTPTPEERLNSDAPNGNARILVQARFGNASKTSSIWTLRQHAGGGYHMRGRRDGWNGVGTLGPQGLLTDFQSTVYAPNDVCCVPASGSSPAAFIAVGSRDDDGDGESELGNVTTYSHACTPLLELPFASDTSDVWLNRLAPLTDSTYLVAGGERRRGTEYPFLAVVKLVAGGQPERLASATLLALPNRWFATGLAVLPKVDPDAPELDLATQTNGDDLIHRLHGIRVTLPDLSQVSMEWTRDIVARPGSETHVNRIVSFGDNIYVAGNTVDDRKTTPDASGWRSGVVASYGRDGTPRWMTVVSLTIHGESYTDLTVSSAEVDVVGQAAAFMFTNDPKEVFGYGFVTRLNPATGAVIENLTLGDPRNSSGFDTAVRSGATLVCGGWGNYELNDGAYQAWLCTVNSDMGSASTPIAATAARGAANAANAAPIPGRSRWGRELDGR